MSPASLGSELPNEAAAGEVEAGGDEEEDEVEAEAEAEAEEEAEMEAENEEEEDDEEDGALWPLRRSRRLSAALRPLRWFTVLKKLSNSLPAVVSSSFAATTRTRLPGVSDSPGVSQFHHSSGTH